MSITQLPSLGPVVVHAMSLNVICRIFISLHRDSARPILGVTDRITVVRIHLCLFFIISLYYMPSIAQLFIFISKYSDGQLMISCLLICLFLC